MANRNSVLALFIPYYRSLWPYVGECMFIKKEGTKFQAFILKWSNPITGDDDWFDVPSERCDDGKCNGSLWESAGIRNQGEGAYVGGKNQTVYINVREIGRAHV